MSTSNDHPLIIRQQLTRPFAPTEVSIRVGRGGRSFHYLAWTAVQSRLDRVLGFDWDFMISDQTCIAATEGTRKGYLASTVAGLTISFQDADGIWRRSRRDGSDSHFSEDAGDARKSSASGALVKAGSLHGIGLELQDEAWRELITFARQTLPNISTPRLKKQIMDEVTTWAASTGRDMPAEPELLVETICRWSEIIGEPMNTEQLSDPDHLRALVFAGAAQRIRPQIGL
jgi:hypothetical protein